MTVAIRAHDERIAAELRGDYTVQAHRRRGVLPERCSGATTLQVICTQCAAVLRVAACWTAVRCSACGTDHFIGEN